MENITPVSQQPGSAKVDTHSYKGWMNSDSFLKRAFGVWGHYMVAHLMILVPIFIIATVLAILLGGLAANQ